MIGNAHSHEYSSTFSRTPIHDVYVPYPLTRANDFQRTILTRWIVIFQDGLQVKL